MFNLAFFRDCISKSRYSYIGVDIDNHSIRLAEISYKKHTYQLENYAVYPHIPEWKIQLASDFSCNIFRSKNIVLGLSENQVLLKKTILGQNLSSQEKQAFLLLEMEKVALYSSNDMYVDFKILNVLENNLEEIVCAAAKKKTVESALKVFEETSLKIKKITALQKKEEFSLVLSTQVNAEKWEKDREFFKRACEFAINGFDKTAFNFLPSKKLLYRKIILLIGIILLGFFSFFLCYSFFCKEPIQARVKGPALLVMPKKTEKSAIKKIENNLENTSVYHMKMIGFIQQKQKTWAFIKIPNKKIYRVNSGEIVGREQGKVIEIFSEKIILKFPKKQRRFFIEMVK